MHYLIILFVVSVESKGGLYYAEPNFVRNYPNDHPEIAEAYFYLQQTSKWTVLFKGEIQIKQQVGSLQGKLELFSWTGKKFQQTSGAPIFASDSTICDIPGVIPFFRTIEPQSGFIEGKCTFLEGNYTNSIDYNDHLHQSTDQFPYDPIRVALYVFGQGNKTLFGFMLQVGIYDWNLYKYIPKD